MSGWVKERVSRQTEENRKKRKGRAGLDAGVEDKSRTVSTKRVFP